MQKYEKIAAKTAVDEERTEKIKAMIREGATKDFILKVGYTETEYLIAIRS